MAAIKKMVLIPIAKYKSLVKNDNQDVITQHSESQTDLTSCANENKNDATTLEPDIKTDEAVKSEDISHEVPKGNTHTAKTYKGNIHELLYKFKNKIEKKTSKLKRLRKKKKEEPSKNKPKKKKSSANIKWLSL